LLTSVGAAVHSGSVTTTVIAASGRSPLFEMLMMYAIRLPAGAVAGPVLSSRMLGSSWYYGEQQIARCNTMVTVRACVSVILVV